MASIVKGTTPSITYSFSVVSVSELAEAILTLKHRRGMIKKYLSEATVGEESLTWTLTQEETLALNGAASMMLNFVCNDGTRGASPESDITIKSNHINEVI